MSFNEQCLRNVADFYKHCVIAMDTYDRENAFVGACTNISMHYLQKCIHMMNVKDVKDANKSDPDKKTGLE